MGVWSEVMSYPLQEHHVRSELQYGADEVRDAILAAVRYFADPRQGPCRYDHHGSCQEHLLHEHPCPFGTLASVFGGLT